MFGLSWDQLILILLAALFLLGPERIPTAIKWLMDSLRKLRTFAAGAQSEMRSQLGPELDELRRQIAELQSLKEIKELKELRDLDPRRMVGKSLLGDEFSGGVKGFLGLNGDGPDSAEAASAAENAAVPSAPAAVTPPPAPSAPSSSTASPATPTASADGDGGAQAGSPQAPVAGQWGDVT